MTARPGLVFSPEAPTDARIETTWNNMSNPGAFAVAGANRVASFTAGLLNPAASLNHNNHAL
jgi:hypothetical protein